MFHKFLQHCLKIAAMEKSFMKGRFHWCGKLHCCLIIWNRYSNLSLQHPPSWSVSNHRHQSKTLYQQEHYDSLKAEMMVRFFSKRVFFLIFTWGHVFIDLRERERERWWGGEREKHWCKRETLINCLLYAPWPKFNSWFVPWPEFEPTTLWCMGQCSNQLSHLARATIKYF